MNQTYISLDLETTGFDPSNDQVLEIAAIKFQGNQIIEQFETLINPGVEIPAMVSHITGISAETVKDAPSFESVSSNLSRFIGNFPIVGHNIDFDLTFLEAKGIPITNKQFDTFHLASILLPNLPSYSLETISRQLKISHTNKHRAMSDAHVCFELFLLLMEKIKSIPPQTLSQIQQLVRKSDWDMTDLFMVNSEVSDKTKTKPIQTQHPKTSIIINDSEELVDLLSKNSPLQEIIPDFEARPGQQKLLQKITKAFTENHHLIAEAGTGTGKTMAYLLASAFLTKHHKEKIIISTHTNNLQDQIIKKDFPLIQQIFPTVKLSVLKGRRKYLSLERFNNLKNKEELEDHEITAFIKILIWLEQTDTGDLDEVNLQNKELVLLDQICSHPDQKPTGHQIDFLENARLQAEQSDLIVVNHALLIQDSLSASPILPQSHYLVIDEAHHLEKTLTDALTIGLSQNRLFKLWERFLETFNTLWQNTLLFESSMEDLNKAIGEAKITNTNLVEKAFDKLRLVINKYGKAQPGIPHTLSLTQNILDNKEWQNFLDQIKPLNEQVLALAQLGQKLNQTLLSHDLENNDLLYDFNQILDYLRNLQSFNSIKNQIFWIHQGMDEAIFLFSAPLTIQNTLQETLFAEKNSIILTSATLTTYGNFNYLRQELGLNEHFEEVRIASHFSYPDQVKIIIPEDLPEPKLPSYLGECTEIIDQVIRTNQGRCLVLFTAKKDLAKVYHDLAPGLKTAGISLLGQSLSGGRGKILAHFQDEPEKSAILGTNSFWEGVDLIGPALTCVIIQKLPFDPPDDPIVFARSQLFEKAFEQYALPRAILRFKQGFGRLIRSSKDTGSVIILDSRLVQKAYGKEFVASLPEGIKIHQCQSDKVASHL